MIADSTCRSIPARPPTFSALVLGVTLYALTREQAPDPAMMGLICRVTESVIGAVGIESTLGVLWLATATGASAPDPAAAHALGSFLLRGNVALTATFFAVGSTSSPICSCVVG